MCYVGIKDTCDLITKAHIATGHGGRNRVMKHLSSKYANITREAVELFKSFCVMCHEKKKAPLGTICWTVCSEQGALSTGAN